MPSLINITGNKYGRLTAISKAETIKKRTFWNVVCDCGTTTKARTAYLRNGKTSSCGCYQKESAKTNMTKHGRASDRATDEFKKYSRELHIKIKYNLSIEKYNEMLSEQNNKCAICSYEFGQKSGDTYVDHCHTTKKVRGLLCQHCNSGLGYFKDSNNNLKNAINYLAK